MLTPLAGEIVTHYVQLSTKKQGVTLCYTVISESESACPQKDQKRFKVKINTGARLGLKWPAVLLRYVNRILDPA